MATTATPWCGTTANKLYLQSGQFSSTMKTSLAVGTVESDPSGITYDINGHTPWSGGGDNKLYLQSGQFSSTMKTSLYVGGVDSNPFGISSDVNGHTPWAGDAGNKLYLNSGQFESTMKTSLDVVGIDSQPHGISYDANGHTPWIGSTNKKLFLNSGQFESTVKSSLVVSGIESQPRGISFDGTNTPWCGWGGGSKLRLQSGQFESTMKTSISVAGVDSSVGDICTDDVNARIGSFGPTTLTITPTAIVLVAPTTTLVFEGLDLTIVPTALTLVAPAMTYSHAFGTETSGEPDRIPRQPARTRRAMSQAGFKFNEPSGLILTAAGLKIRHSITGGLGVNTAGNYVVAQDPIFVNGGGVGLTLQATPGLVISSGLAALLKSGGHLAKDANGLYVDTTSLATLFVPYTGATANVNLGAFNLTTTGTGTFGYVNITDQANGYQIDGVTMFAFSATDNILIGENAGNSITTGDYNICFGKDSGTTITDGYSNVCIGFETGKLLDGGYQNTILGAYAGKDMAEGYDNTLLGAYAGENLTSGFENMCVGTSSGAFITTGDRNTLVGFSAGQGIVTDNNNTFIGFQAGFPTKGGEDNTAIGRSSGLINTTGDGNTWIGMRTGNISTGLNYCIVIGYHADATAANQMVVGSVEAPITAIYMGEGVTSASPQDLTFNATGGSGSNVAAGDLIFAGGRSTGNADPGDILFQTTVAGASGSTLQTLATRVTINETGIVIAANLDVVQSGTGHFTAGSEGFIVGTLTITDGSIVDSDGSITYGGTNFSSVGTIGCDTITLTANSDIEQSGTGHVTAGSEGFKVGTLTITDGTIDDTDGTIVFGDTNLTTTGAITAGASTFGDGGSTNYLGISATGDLTFVGSAGLAYGEISCYDEGDTITIAGTGIANKVQVTSFDTNGPSNNVTPDHTNDHITITVAGHYLCTVSISIESAGGGGADEVGLAAYKNNGATLFENLHAHRKLAGGGGDTGSVSISGIIDLAVDDTIEFWIWNENSTDDIVVDDATLSLIQIGGT